MKKETISINIDDLKDYKYNNKNHSKEQIEEIKKSIQKV